MNGMEPNIFSDVLVKMMATTPESEHLRLGVALDAAIAFGMWQAKAGKIDHLTREQIRDRFFELAARL